MIDLDKISSESLSALRGAGWHENRQVDVSEWIELLAAQGYHINEPARSTLQAFGGLSVEPVNEVGPNFENGEPLNFEPIDAGFGHHLLAEELHEALGGNWYPLGEWISSSSVFVDDRGWTVATGLGWIWELGKTVEEAINLALLANRPLICLKVLTPGAKPWPPDGS
ncbi:MULTISPECIES: SUKH-3 domain-containing protein [unclassified Solwaraspora]|uniref:SUKH-3 domain-containing protein n=1 Tax=unclassified Solwaraspora TaxID=2627926 RepID=UPI00259B6406|nr:SUKH-3 domain-containing protein [Solwaraspora sp. WMMA2056]WJK39521.1 SUKH-3 domain-containing protein [Solwaraspora sp. WMMA2056]